MKITIEKGKATFDMRELFECMDREQLMELVCALACQEEVIDEVCNQIVEGYTSDVSCGFKCLPGGLANTALSKAQRLITKNSSEIAAKENDGLVRAIKRAKALEDHYRVWAFELYHQMRADGINVYCPELPDWSEQEMYEVVKKEEA
ncbi:hypothetical protein OAF54_02930 [bacterium]|nr:hypothetical protein [bacterium]